MPDFRDELAALLNRHSKENGSNTPDFLLASFLEGCLTAFDQVVKERGIWLGTELEESVFALKEREVGADV